MANDAKKLDEQKEQTMFEKLSPELQEKIKHFLENNDFRAAKALYDEALKTKDE